jgi:hypothetical protein
MLSIHALAFADCERGDNPGVGTAANALGDEVSDRLMQASDGTFGVAGRHAPRGRLIAHLAGRANALTVQPALVVEVTGIQDAPWPFQRHRKPPALTQTYCGDVAVPV